jgi:hypothetical protein
MYGAPRDQKLRAAINRSSPCLWETTPNARGGSAGQKADAGRNGPTRRTAATHPRRRTSCFAGDGDFMAVFLFSLLLLFHESLRIAGRAASNAGRRSGHGETAATARTAAVAAVPRAARKEREVVVAL